MRNKLVIALLAGVLFVPAFAAEEAVLPAKADARPAMAEKKGEFLKAQKEHRAKMKATEEKMEKLVKEYKKLKGKKQETKKAEITAEVAKIREEQLKFKQAQLEKFAQRLEEMKKHMEQAKTAEAQKIWVQEKTDALIDEDGDLKVLFERDGHGPQGKHKMHARKGFKGFGKGPRPELREKEDGERVGIYPPPPPPLEEK